MNVGKEISKFLAGFFFEGLWGHIWLASSGLLPIKTLGITVNSTVNSFAIVFHSVITFLLVYFAWFQKKKKFPSTPLSTTT